MRRSRKREQQNGSTEKKATTSRQGNSSHTSPGGSDRDESDASVSMEVSKPSEGARTKSKTRPKSPQKTSQKSPAAQASSLQPQQSTGQGHFDVYPVVTFFRSGTDMNNSRTETLTRESQAVIANMALSNLAVDKNANWLTTFKVKEKPQDPESGNVAEGTVPASSGRSRVTFADASHGTAEQPSDPARKGKVIQNGILKQGPDDQNMQPLVPYRDQTLVELKVVFVRVFDVDTRGQKFEAEVYIQARWTESQFAGYSEQELEEVEFRECWDPMLTVLNVAGSLNTDKASMLLQYEPDRVYPMLTYMWHIQGVFRESMELQHFPFDVQEISVVISTGRTVKEVELVCDYSQISNVDPRALQGNQEWTAYRHVEFTRDYNTLETLSTTKYPVLVASAHVKRKLGFYFWNIILIVILILTMSFTILGVEIVSGRRLLTTSTLFLSCIAFKLVVKATLPNVPYLTYLDMYVIFALVFLALQAVENSIMLHLIRFRVPAEVDLYDEVAQFCLITILIAFHLAFIIHIQVNALSRRRSMSDKELEFETAKINLIKKKQEKMEKEKDFAAENSLFKQTQTSDTLLSTLRERGSQMM